MVIDATLVSLVSAVTALIASILGPLVTLYVTRTQIRASVQSVNRQRWIEEFRDILAQFCSEIAIAVQMREKIVRNGRIVIEAESEFVDSFRRLIYTANKIRLMINPLEQEHQEMLEAIDHLFARFRTALPDEDLQTEGLQTVGKLVTLGLSIVRREWLLVQRGV